MRLINVAVLSLAMLGALNLPAQPTVSPATNLQERVFQLEVEHRETIKSLTASNESFRWLVYLISALIGILVTIQGVISIVQIRREHRREDRELERQKNYDESAREREKHESKREEEHEKSAGELHTRNLGGMDKVNEIMSVMQQTFQSRLDAEKEERKKAEAAQEQLKAIRDEIQVLTVFLQKHKATIKSERERIERQALDWATRVPRHGFRGMANQLKSFATEFDKFKTEFEPAETPPGKFTARVPYIRGIAAHYDNQPEKAKECLDEVVSASGKEDKEDETAFNRRRANAYYYLGIIESNFGRPKEAISKFTDANQLDPLHTDFLTKIVTAEAYIMDNDLREAEKCLADVEQAVDRERNSPGLRPAQFNQHLNLYYRASLLRANMAIISRASSWRADAEKYLKKIHAEKPLYYFATATLGQVAQHHGQAAQAQQLFKEAYESIKDSGDLTTVMETRSLILLLLFAGMCSKHGTMDLGRANDYFAKAEGLCTTLPRLRSDVCTVFSPLTKRNEPLQRIADHIEMLRNGTVLL